MPIDPTAVGATTEPQLFTWSDRDTLLYALGVGCGTADLAFTTENSHDIDQQVLPTYAVIACPAFGAVAKVGTFNFGMLLHGSQQIRLFAPLPPAGALSVVSEVVDIQDKGEGKNAVVVLKGTGSDPQTAEVVVETVMTLVIRGEPVRELDRTQLAEVVLQAIGAGLRHDAVEGDDHDARIASFADHAVQRRR